MKARVLVLAVNDGDEYVELAAIADEGVMENNERWMGEQVEQAKADFGKSLDAYGFIDIEIPDGAIAKVTCRQVTVGGVATQVVEENGGCAACGHVHEVDEPHLMEAPR